jgi:dihydrodipicolinate synthase/N-acetylneuraminate lyase
MRTKDIDKIRQTIDYVRQVCAQELPTMKTLKRDGHIIAIKTAMNDIESIVSQLKRREPRELKIGTRSYDINSESEEEYE